MDENGEEVCHDTQVSMLVGASRCTHCFQFLEILCLHCLLQDTFLSKPNPPKFVHGENRDILVRRAACTCCRNKFPPLG